MRETRPELDLDPTRDHSFVPTDRGSNLLEVRLLRSLKFSGKRGKKDSIKMDSIPQALDIRLLRLDRGVVNEGDSARVRS